MLGERRAEVEAVMLERRTQTNEPARCALHCSRCSPRSPSRSRCSRSARARACACCPTATRYDYDGHRARATGAPPVLRCRPEGDVPLPTALPEVVWRAGLDLNPLDVTDPDQVRWLELLVWPGQEHRLEVLRGASRCCPATTRQPHDGPWAGRPDGAPGRPRSGARSRRARHRLPPGRWSSSATVRVGARRDSPGPRPAGDGRAQQRRVGPRFRCLRGGALLLGAAEWLAEHRPERVLVVGRPTLSRPVNALLADPEVRVETVAASPRWPTPPAQRLVGGELGGGHGREARRRPPGRREWQRAGRSVGAAVDAVLDAAPGLTAARLARDVVAALPSGALLVLGSSTPVRDVDRLAVPRARPRRAGQPRRRRDRRDDLHGGRRRRSCTAARRSR